MGKQLRNIWEKQDNVKCVNPAKTTNLARKNQISKKNLIQLILVFKANSQEFDSKYSSEIHKRLSRTYFTTYFMTEFTTSQDKKILGTTVADPSKHIWKRVCGNTPVHQKNCSNIVTATKRRMYLLSTSFITCTSLEY